MRHSVLILIALTCSLAATSAAPASSASTTCRPIIVPVAGSTDRAAYGVKVLRGPVACRTARSVLRIFLVGGTSPHGWLCFRGHTSQNQTWAASCSRRSSLVRAYPKPKPKPV
jgi:hypothetical protein